MALKSTEIFGYMIKSFERKINITESIDNFKEKNLWLPSKILRNEKNFKKIGSQPQIQLQHGYIQKFLLEG